MKRAADVLVAAALLALLAPLMLVIAALVRLDSPGPALFRQLRGGFRGAPFHIYKFRTMTCMDDGPVVRQAQDRDPRVTRLGAILRRTSFDEIPQLVNVLKGDMSLVGPRPHALAHDREFAAVDARYLLRHVARPGLTGLAQASGSRGATPTVQSVRERIELDLRYVESWSLALDFRIAIATAWQILSGR